MPSMQTKCPIDWGSRYHPECSTPIIRVRYHKQATEQTGHKMINGYESMTRVNLYNRQLQRNQN
jgi:hypothetical protein